jgi:hypothetical protein
MRLFRLLAVSALASSTALVGCSSEDSDPTDTGTDAAETGTDAGTGDTTPDTAVDATPDTAPDTTVDATPDAAPDTTPDAATDGSGGTVGPTLEDLHASIIVPTCGGAGCHIGAFPGAGLDLALDAGLLDRLLAESTQSDLPLIEPGVADDSYFYLKVTGEHTLAGGSGGRMPLNRQPLSDDQIAELRDYIEITLAP